MLVERLNKYNGNPVVEKGTVTVELVPDEGQLGPDGTVTDPDLELFLEQLETAKKYLDVHPRHGRDGGYVAVVVLDGEAAFYDEHENEWEATRV